MVNPGRLTDGFMDAQIGGYVSADQAGDVFSGMLMQEGALRRSVGAAESARRGDGTDPRGGSALARPIVPPGDDPRAGAGAGTGLIERAATADATRDEPLTSFVDTEQNVLNQYLAEGEKLLKEGQYYRAARAYTLARTIDYHNPLPLLGRAMSYLAAGDYMTSAVNLFQAIESFERLSEYRIDLPAFIPDVTVLDRRRADLERRLEAYEDFRLRFLLGFAEICSGFEEMGIANLERAVQNAPPGMSALTRFVTGLEQRVRERDTRDEESTEQRKPQTP
jgi:tetratricopeptide (TPR) repeat protein